MATPLIQSTGASSGAGTAGEGRKDLVQGELVTLSDAEVANAGETFLWALEDRPIGSAAVLSSTSSETPTFTADVVGSYRVRLTINGAESAVVVIAVPLPNTGARIPSFQETFEYNAGGNLKGWHEAMDDFMREADNVAGGSDLSAIHDDQAGEINAIAEKVSPEAADLVLIEDSSDSFNKKKAQAGNLPIPAHDLGGAEHNADTLANLNAKISDATLDDSSDPRTPTAHATSHEDGGSDELTVQNLGSGAATVGQILEADGAGGWNLAAPPVGGSKISTESPDFDGSNDGASIAHGSQNGLAITGDITIECWVKADNTGGNPFFVGKFENSAGPQHAYRFRHTPSGLEFIISTDGTNNFAATVSDTLPADEWVHYAVTREQSSGDTNFYRNGVQVGTTQVLQAATAIFAGTNDFSIARAPDTATNAFAGQMAEVRVWDTVRTVTEIEENHRRPLSGAETNLQGYWRLDQDFVDDSPNSNDLSAIDAPVFERDVPFGVAADQLVTKGGTIDLKDSSTPNPGQVLTATSGTEADWQDLTISSKGAPSQFSTNLLEASAQAWEITSGAQNGSFQSLANMTIECWIRPTNLGENRTIVDNSATTSPFGYKLRVTSAGALQALISTNGTSSPQFDETPSPVFANNEWRHVALTWNGSTGDVKHYVDGQQIGTTSAGPTGTTHDPASLFRIGDNSESIEDAWGGNISDLRIWSAERSQPEIEDNMRRRLTGSESGLVAYWPFDNDALDKTNNGNDLTARNGADFEEHVPFGSPAHSLVTENRTVQITGGAPTAGDVLEATSATEASWQAPSGGGGPGSDTTAIHDDTAAEISAVTQKTVLALDDLLLIEDSEAANAKKSATVASILGAGVPATSTPSIALGGHSSGMTSPSVDDVVPLDSTVFESGRLSVDLTNNRILGFKAGHTYKLVASYRTQFDGGALKFYDVAAAADIATSDGGSQFPMDDSNNTSNWMPRWAYFTPTQDTSVELRVLSVDSASTDFTRAYIVAEEKSAPLPPGQFAQGDYLRAELSVDQTGPVADDDVEFDTVDQARGGLALDAGTGVISNLRAGRTWKVSWAAATKANADDEAIRSTVYNHTLGSFVGNDAFSVGRSENGSNGSSNNEYIFTPTVDTSISIRVKGVGGTPDLDSTLSWVIVEEVGATAPTAQGDKFAVYLSADQTDPDPGDALAFDSIAEARGGFSLNGSNQVEGFKAGRTYILLANLRFQNGSASFRKTCAFYDATGAAEIGTRVDFSSNTSGGDVTSGGTLFHVFTPTVDSAVELRVVAEGSAATADAAGGSASGDTDCRWEIIEVGTAAPPVIGGLEFLDEIVVGGSAVQEVTFSSSGDGNRQHDVNGSLDGQYKLICLIQKTASSTSVVVRPNGATANQETEYNAISAGSNNASVHTDIRLANATSADHLVSQVDIFPNDVGEQFFQIQTNGSAAGNLFYATAGATWDDTSNITSLVIRDLSGANLQPGSIFRLYRVTPKTTDARLQVTSATGATYAVKDADDVISFDPATTTQIDLPAIGASNKGRVLYLKNETTDTTTVTINPAGADTIDGAASLNFSESRGSLILVSDGTSEWMIL